MAVIALDGVVVGLVQEADTEEGWVDQKLTNWYRAIIGMPAVSPEEEQKIVRRYGKVEYLGQADD